MTNKLLEWYEYDEEGDVLDVYFGEKEKAWTIELTEHIMISINRQRRHVVALSFLDFTELIRPTPLGPRSFPLTGLANLPISERDLVVELITTPPINKWLDISTVQTLPDSPFSITHLQKPPTEVFNLVAV